MGAASVSLYLGAAVVVRRLQGRSLAIIAGGTVAFTAIVAYAERVAGARDAASRVLQGPVFGLAIPLAVLSLVAMATSRGRLDQALESAAAIGASRRLAALGSLGALGAISAVIAVIAGVLGAWISHGAEMPGAITDAFTSGWIAALSGIAYSALFGAGSTFGAKGGGRNVFWIIDLILGPVVGPAAVFFPRAHALNLLGAQASWSQPASSVALVLLCLLFWSMAVRRVPP